MGHVVEETLNPQWDTRVEFFTADYTQVCFLNIKLFFCQPFTEPCTRHSGHQELRSL